MPKVVGHVTLHQAMEMAVALNMEAEQEAGQAVLPILHMPTTNNRVVPVFSVQAEEEAEEQEPLVVVKI